MKPLDISEDLLIMETVSDRRITVAACAMEVGLRRITPKL
jgi:hypothetical protein